MKKRIISLLLVMALLLSMAPMVTIEAEAATNIVINGVDIEYADGDYFTKDGYSCRNDYWLAYINENNKYEARCHKHGVCTEAVHEKCNCMRYWPTGDKNDCEVDLKASQCFGFSRYCQWKVFGCHDGNSSGSFEDIVGYLSTSNCTESALKSRLLGCAPATHIRLGTNSKGHSMSVISTSESGIEIAECNYDGYCRIRTKSYTWAGFASEVQSHCRKYGYDGIGYMKAWKDWEGNETPVNLGTDFYARILNSEYWKPITNDSDRFVRLREETGNLDQIWHFEREEDGGYLITSAKNGYALEMFAGEREPGTPAAAWCEDWGGYYQRWYIYNRNGCYVFVSKHFSSEQWALELQNNDDTDGTAITINTLNNESEQL